MSSSTSRALGRAITPSVRREASIAGRLARYAPHVRLRVQALARVHPRLADLALSHPALLFALAAPRPGFNPATVIAHVLEGANLVTAGTAAGVPAWSRKLPPEAFTLPLSVLPDGELFRCHIANHLPRSPRVAPLWLAAVTAAAADGHDPFAVWIAREVVRNPRTFEHKRVRLLALWAWYSKLGVVPQWALPEKRWEPGMRWQAATAAADHWSEQILLHLTLGEQPVGDMWLMAAVVDGYEFEPIRTALDMVEEAKAMRNCVMRFGGGVADDRMRFWSVRKDGARVATLQLGMGCDGQLIGIRQLKLADNERAPAEVWLAANKWLMAHDLGSVRAKVKYTDACDHAAWIKLWKPYWLAKRRIPAWLPLTPSRRVIWNCS